MDIFWWNIKARAPSCWSVESNDFCETMGYENIYPSATSSIRPQLADNWFTGGRLASKSDLHKIVTGVVLNGKNNDSPSNRSRGTLLEISNKKANFWEEWQGRWDKGETTLRGGIGRGGRCWLSRRPFDFRSRRPRLARNRSFLKSWAFSRVTH